MACKRVDIHSSCIQNCIHGKTDVPSGVLLRTSLGECYDGQNSEINSIKFSYFLFDENRDGFRNDGLLGIETPGGTASPRKVYCI